MNHKKAVDHTHYEPDRDFQTMNENQKWRTILHKWPIET